VPAGTGFPVSDMLLHSCLSVAEPELELELESEQDQLMSGWSTIFMEIEPALGFSKTNFKVPASFVLMLGIE